MGRARILHGSGYTKPRRIAQNRRADYGLYTVCGIWGMYRMMDVRAARVCVRGRRRPPHGLDYGSREEAISEIPGGRLIRWPPRARIVEKSKSRGSILIVFSPSRHFENFLWIFFLMIILNSNELIFSSILKKSLDSEDTGSINYTLWFNSFVISFR